MNPSRTVTLPIDTRDITAAVGRTTLGLLLLAVGWFQASDRLLLEDQAPWLALAAGGVVAASLAVVLWLLQLRRAVSCRLADVRTRLELVDLHDATSTATEALVAIVNSAAHLYHHASCPLVSNRPTRAASAEEHLAAGRVACEVCADV